MYGIRDVPTKELIALRFADDGTFQVAARIAAERKLPVALPGEHTLIIKISDRHLFAEANLRFEENQIIDPEEVPR